MIDGVVDFTGLNNNWTDFEVLDLRDLLSDDEFTQDEITLNVTNVSRMTDQNESQLTIRGDGDGDAGTSDVLNLVGDWTAGTSSNGFTTYSTTGGTVRVERQYLRYRRRQLDHAR